MAGRRGDAPVEPRRGGIRAGRRRPDITNPLRRGPRRDARATDARPRRPIFVHREDAPYVARNDLPPWTARNGLEALHRLYYRRLDLPDLPIRRVEDGDAIGGFRVFHTPGHTPGHVAFVHEALDAAFLGDLAYTVGGELRPSGRFTSYDHRQAAESVRSLSEWAPPFEYACPGHGRPLEDGYEQLSQTV